MTQWTIKSLSVRQFLKSVKSLVLIRVIIQIRITSVGAAFRAIRPT